MFCHIECRVCLVGKVKTHRTLNEVRTLSLFADLAVRYLPGLEKRLSTSVECSSDAVQAVVSHILSTRGKRIRPLLTLAAGMCVSDVTDPLLDAACAIELVHTASLVHDDVLDRAQERRGVVTLNARWGNQIAVLTGDLLLSRALGMLTPYSACGAVDIVSDAIARMCESEIEQAERAFDPDITEQEYIRRIGGKTSALLKAACITGALVAGAPNSDAQNLGQFGYHLGTAFQIADDVLDFLGDPDDMGKPICTDLKSGIITLPAIYLLAHGARGQYLRDALRQRSVGRRMKRILRDLEDTGALMRSIHRAMEFLEAARASLQSLGPSQGRKTLESALQLITDRISLQLSEQEIRARLGIAHPSEHTVIPQPAAYESQ